MEKIRGHRTLTQAEMNLINSIKSHGVLLEGLLQEVERHLRQQREGAITPVELKRLDDAEPGKWMDRAKAHFQEGLMGLSRAVAQPELF
jgi:hypothetical protein